MDKSVSILIPTHNRAEILSGVLESLKQIRIPDGIEPELIVIANGCSDDTEAVVAAAASEIRMPTRCVVENKLGLSVARNRGVLEAKNDVLAFLDDDVWVEPEWLAELCNVYESESADVVGGRVLLWWAAVDPPSWMDKRFEVLFSGCDHGEEVFEIDNPAVTNIIGANFSFTREVWLQIGQFDPGLGRVGQGLLCGEESEFVFRARNAGFRSFYAPLACVKHLVSPFQLEPRYLRRISFDFGRTNSFLNLGGSKARAFLVIVWQPLRALTNFALAAFSSLTDDRVLALSRGLAGISRLGRAFGAIELLTGRSPLGTTLRNEDSNIPTGQSTGNE